MGATGASLTFQLTVTDNGGLTDHDTAAVTVTAAPVGVMHAASIMVILKKSGPNTAGVATVTILDAAGDPVSGVTIQGRWSGPTSDSDIGTTNTAGQVILQSNYIKKARSGTTFTFTLDNATRTGWVFDRPGSTLVGSAAVP